MAQFVVFDCHLCGRPGEAPLEDGDELVWEERGIRICAACLDRMFGFAEEVWKPGERSD